MGVQEEQTLMSIEQLKKCLKCHTVLDKPVQMPCGKNFCSACALPPVIQKGICADPFCKEVVTLRDLKSSPELQHTNFNLSVKCDFAENGCCANLVLAELPSHIVSCKYGLVHCRNYPCTKMVIRKGIQSHEQDSCHFRPVGICQDGCGMVIRHHEQTNNNIHNCTESLKGYIAEQELKISSLEADIQTVLIANARREKGLLNRIGSLHNMIQIQARNFQRRVNDCRNDILELAAKESCEDDLVCGFNSFILILKAFKLWWEKHYAALKG